MSALPALVSVEEYLCTAYRPDCDYVDGIVEDRKVGGDGVLRTQNPEIAVPLSEIFPA